MAERDKMKKVSDKDLQKIFEMAHIYYVNSTQQGLSHQQFVAKCYLEACAKILDVTELEFEEKVPYSAADE